jgi:hypothetical protein
VTHITGKIHQPRLGVCLEAVRVPVQVAGGSSLFDFRSPGAYYVANAATMAFTPIPAIGGDIYAVPFVAPARGGVLDRIGISLTSGIAGGTARLGIYENVSPPALYPGALLLDAGTVSLASAVPVYATISQALVPGRLYWLAFIPSATVFMQSLQTYATSTLLGMDSTLAAGAAEYTYTIGNTTLPSTFAGGATAGSNCHAVGVRFSA